MMFWELPCLLTIVCSKQTWVIACSDLSGAMEYALVSESEVTRQRRAPSWFFELVFVCRLDANKC